MSSCVVVFCLVDVDEVAYGSSISPAAIRFRADCVVFGVGSAVCNDSHSCFYRWYAEQGCPAINRDYSWTPTVSKVCEEAEVTLSSESDSDSYYSDRFDGVCARNSTTPPNTHVGTAST
jgi:hypothetical protein